MAAARTNTGNKDRKHQETDFYPADIWLKWKVKKGKRMLKRQEGDRIWTKPTNGSKATSQKPEKQPLNNGMYSRLMPRKKHKNHIDARESSFTCNSSKQRETLWFLFLWFIVRQFVPKPDALSWTFEVKWNPSDTFSCHTSLSAWRRAAGSSCDEELAQRHRLSSPSLCPNWVAFYLICLWPVLQQDTRVWHFKDERYLPLHRTTLRDLTATKLWIDRGLATRRRGGGGDESFVCFLALWRISNQTTFPLNFLNFFNICIYSCLPRVWCTVLFHVALECYFTFKVSLSYILQSVIVVK